MTQPMDDHFLSKYRELLDAEDAAFDDLEHACEDGDRARFTQELAIWQEVVGRKVAYLHHVGIEVPLPVS